jgi:hypothetical protein
LSEDTAGGPLSPDTHESLYATQRGKETTLRVESASVSRAVTLVPLKRGPSTCGGGAMLGLPNIRFVAEAATRGPSTCGGGTMFVLPNILFVEAAVVTSVWEGIAVVPSARTRQIREEMRPIMMASRVYRRREERTGYVKKRNETRSEC